MDAQGCGGAIGRVLAPELIDQPVGGNDLVGMEKEGSQQRSRLAATERYLTASVPNLERPEDPKLHPLPPGADANTLLRV